MTDAENKCQIRCWDTEQPEAEDKKQWCTKSLRIQYDNRKLIYS